MKFTVENIRSAVESSMISTGSGDGSNEREELDFEWLTRHLNDLAEQETCVCSKGSKTISKKCTARSHRP